MRKKKLHTFQLALVALFPLLLLCGGLYFCFQKTGFRPGKISFSDPVVEEWVPLSFSQERIDFLFDQVFSQTYHYLASGCFCYAFVSEDDRFVLKFFKTPHLQTKGEKERIFSSYIDAYQELGDETGLLYLHLNPSHELKTKLSLIDNKGKRYVVDLDETEFIVQEKAEPLHDRLERLFKQKNERATRQAIETFFTLIAKRCAKGFSSQDVSLKHNFGFCGERAIQIGCTMLMRDEGMKYPSNFREEILQVAERLNQWARTSNPDLCLLIQEEAQRVINNSF